MIEPFGVNCGVVAGHLAWVANGCSSTSFWNAVAGARATRRVTSSVVKHNLVASQTNFQDEPNRLPEN